MFDIVDNFYYYIKVLEWFCCYGNIFLEGTFMVVTAARKWRDFFNWHHLK